MKKFLNLIISAVLILPTVLPTVIIFNDNQTKVVSISNNNLSAPLAFITEDLQINIDLSGFSDMYLGTTKVVDLTALTGISSIEMFKKFYSKLELPDFYAGVGLFTRTPAIHSLSFNIAEWKEEWWISKAIILIADNETIGSAYIDGILKTRIEILRHLDLHHLLFRMHFYGSGTFESTAKHPMGGILTGKVMKLWS